MLNDSQVLPFAYYPHCNQMYIHIVELELNSGPHNWGVLLVAKSPCLICNSKYHPPLTSDFKLIQYSAVEPPAGVQM